MLHRTYIFIQEYETSILRNEYEFLYNKDKRLKCDKEAIVEYGNDLVNCKIFSA